MATLSTDTLGGLLPRSVSEDIWKAATQAAVVPTLAKAHPIILGENIIPVLSKRPAASIVGELENKPGSEIELGAKSIKPIKAVVGLEFSMETVHANPANVMDMLSEELSEALARQIDLAILHGRQASTGTALSGDPDYINKTTNRVELTDNPAAADQALWDGYELVVGGEKAYNFTGFGFDPRFTARLANARDKEGRRLNPDIPMGGGLSNYSGQPVVTSRTISGQVDASDDSGVRAFGGDWEQLRFGRALDINLKKIEYGDPFGNGDLQRRNAVAFLSEVIFGWGILNTDAFVAYDAPKAE
ncbi:major capsid protein [Corynebacterium sp. HMSC22B11]|uniref:phage major capsid protein n=1 Tax=Corynebacterium sp. HMSC22B11 TaxID=1581056 RepID=UPI0008A2A88B|nr:phage major capsid protein [Corynebacterium sp. HMSC22B11]OFO13747.1 major capsid protein [Corynebacterium sp. HMSC22B11]